MAVPDIWPFSPAVQAQESLEFLTDIRITPQGEMRDALRDARLGFAYNFIWDDATNARAAHMFRSNLTGDWLLPVWSEITQGRVIAAAGVLALPVSTDASYVVGGAVFLQAADGSYAQGVVGAPGAGLMTLDEVTPFEVVAVAPMVLAFVVGSMGGKRHFVGHTVRSLEFSVRDGAHWGTSPFEIYVGYDVLTDPSVIAQPIDTQIIQAREYVDNGFGQVAVEPLRDVIEGKTQLVFLDFGAADMWRRKRWFHWLRGRDRAFWLPSWGDDFALAAPMVYNQTFVDVTPFGDDPAHLVGQHIMLDDGAGYLFREIEAASLVGAAWRFTIAAPGRAISEARISRMSLMRLDTDRIELELTGAHYMRVAVTATEVAA